MTNQFRVFVQMVAAVVLLLPAWAYAVTIQVQDTQGSAVETAMVTLQPAKKIPMDTSDNGYPPLLKSFTIQKEYTVFTDSNGIASVQLEYAAPMTVRVRIPGYKDALAGPVTDADTLAIAITRETDPKALALAKPANVWAHAINVGNEEEKLRFNMQCGFCHQQGSAAVRVPRTKEVWHDVIVRMIGYGSRLPSSQQESSPQKLVDEYARLDAHPEALGEPLPWSNMLSQAVIEEIPVGDAFSQMHDMYLHPDNGMVYVGDNLQDRLWEVDPKTGKTTIYRTPHDPDDDLGGLIRARLKTFPKHDDYTSIHSMAASRKDGHLFLTPSNQQRIIEFDPVSKEFTVHRINDGFYPHTIRVDDRDRVWFTLALSNQVGMLDRSTGKFTLYDLPARSLRERITVAAVPTLFWLAARGLPLNKFAIDEISTGVPLPYGIDFTPDGMVYAARLHANDIIQINPKDHSIKSIPFPHLGPRRLRADAEGNLWIGAFPESAIVKLDPKTEEFTKVMMPTLPLGSDTPYSLAVDKANNIVWVTGTASDTLAAYHVDTDKWSVFPMSRRMTFTREIDVAEDGSIYSANGGFPSWHIEDGQPTLIHVYPPWRHVEH